MENKVRNKTIYTIGYTSFSIDDFIDVLCQFNIDCLIDVRSTPYSAHFKDFNKEQLIVRLKSAGKHYRNYSKEFGARQNEQKFFSSASYLDFEKFVQSKQFCEGVTKLEQSCNMGFNLVLMCAEKDPINCHRSAMIGRALKAKGFDVKHILENKSLESQTDVEERMISDFCKKNKINRFQASIFPDEISNLSDEQVLSVVYKEKNAEIAYRQGEE